MPVAELSACRIVEVILPRRIDFSQGGACLASMPLYLGNTLNGCDVKPWSSAFRRFQARYINVIGIIPMQEQPRRELIVAANSAGAEMVEISVADTGPGLPKEVRANLFQPFVTTKPNGMGVGLSVCRSIVEAHHGRLWADDNPGGGTVFRFTLRCSQADHLLPKLQHHGRMTPDR